MGNTLALKLEEAWQRPARWLLLLSPLEWLFALVTALRRWAFRHGWRRSRRPGVPVIVVGNITVGGSGKTPVVIALANALRDTGYEVAVISRGYGGSASGVTAVATNSSAAQVGDEALLIAQSFPGRVYVGRERAAVAERAASEGAEVIVSDDGLQHYGLARDIEIVTVDAAAGFGNGHLLPVGPLREPLRRLGEVDFLLERGGSDPHSALGYRPGHWRRLHGEERRSVDAPGFGPPVHALAAIARPGRFFKTLCDLGLEPREHPLRDHQPLDASLFESLHDLPVVMTAKDAVKCPPLDRTDAWVLHMETVFPDGFMAALRDRIARLQGESR